MAVQQSFTNIKTISQLPTLVDNGGDPMTTDDLMEVSHCDKEIKNGSIVLKYNSRAITAKNMTNFFMSGFIDYLNATYRFPTTSAHVDIERIYSDDPTYDFTASKRVYETFLYVDRPNEGEPEHETNSLSCPCRGTINFKKFPVITYRKAFDYDVSNNDSVMNLSTTRQLMDIASPFYIDDGSSFSTEFKNVENNLREKEEVPLGTEDEKHNRYVFRMTNYRSNTWKATHSGIFTCWGWVDMHTDAYPGNNCEAWMALEGYIGGKWSILQVQPFDKHNGELVSYVGFTFPVHEGLSMRITSGFRVGSNSGKYQQNNGSLTNHIANCFVGGVYYTEMDKQVRSSETPKSVSIGAGEFTPAFNFHEEKLDEDKKSTVAELKAKLNAVIDKLNAISGEKMTVDDL